MNCSVEAEAFWLVGGFDESFCGWGAEDLELGYRLFHAGQHFVVSRRAWSIEIPSERNTAVINQSNRHNTLAYLTYALQAGRRAFHSCRAEQGYIPHRI